MTFCQRNTETASLSLHDEAGRRHSDVCIVPCISASVITDSEVGSSRYRLTAKTNLRETTMATTTMREAGVQERQRDVTPATCMLSRVQGSS